MSFVNKNAQTIAISSSISGEGKTFIALNLAAIIAMSGKKQL
jgi:tyrosine-protein kinase Etk/Wzc